MRIVYLWDADYPWDVRTEKVCRALAGAGHEVHVVARNRARRPLRERLPEGTVHRMPPWRWAGRLDAVLGFPLFFSPRWIAHLSRTLRAVRPHARVARDLPLCPLAIALGRARGVPVVFDMAEDYPARLRDLRDAGVRKRWDFLVRSPAAAAVLERWCLARVDRVLTVVRESAERVVAMGVPPERVAVVSNTPPLARLGALSSHPPKPAGAPLELVYLGLMEAPRGIAEVVRAVALLRERGVAARARLIGGGRELERFRALAAELGLGPPWVELEGYVPYAEALERVARADAGVVPHHATDGWNTTIPNKLFDFMAAALPVVTSDAAPAARIVRETGAGVVFRSGDAESLAAAVASLGDPEARRRMGEAGRAAVRATYHWERDAEVLLAAVASAAGAAGEGASVGPTPWSAKTAPPAAPTRRKAAK